jgi:signal transduction histidine kinase
VPSRADGDVLDREARGGLRPAAWTLAILYLPFSVSHALVQTGLTRAVMVPLTAGEMVLYLGLLWWWRRHPPRASAAHAWLLAVGLLALTNSGALMVLTGEPRQATNLLFLAIGGGYLFLRWQYLAAYVGAILAPYAVTVLRDPSSPEWLHYHYAMMSAIALAVVLHVVRVASTLRLEGARREAETKSAQLRTVLTGAPLILFALERDGTVRLAEGQGLAALGLRPGDVVGRSVYDMYAHNEALTAAVREALEGRSSSATVEEAGRLLDARWTPLPGGGIVGVATDVTDRRRAEEEKARADAKGREAEQLRVLDRLRTTFVNTAAHELNTPLTPIRLQLGLLERMDPAARSRALALVRRNVERLQRIVRDLLTMARLQEGRLSIRPARCDLAAVARGTVESFADTAHLSDVALRLEAPAAVPAWGEAERLQQVMDNLVANAVKFTPAGGSVAVRCRSEGGQAVAEVVDTGIGIASGDLQRLFQPYGQLASGQERGGTGLGLYLVKALIDAHGGKVWVRSDGPGNGATFGFAVPAEPPAPGPTPAASP